jgi:hypothetical protein
MLSAAAMRPQKTSTRNDLNALAIGPPSAIRAPIVDRRRSAIGVSHPRIASGIGRRGDNMRFGGPPLPISCVVARILETVRPHLPLMAEELLMSQRLRLLVPLLLVASTGAAGGGPSGGLRFDAAGGTTAPADYRDWIFLSSGLNMNYSAGGAAAGGDTFDNVFVDRASWRAFKATGHWPEGTVLVKEGRHGDTRGSINRTGQFQEGDAAYVELHVRDRKRFASGWGFFELRGGERGRVLPVTANCYSCHRANGAVETSFVQFYPTAKPIAVRAGTFDARK